MCRLFWKKVCPLPPTDLSALLFLLSARLFACGLPGGSAVKTLPANSGDVGSIPGWGRSPGGGYGKPLQYSCLDDPMDRGVREAWRVTGHGVPERRTYRVTER